MKRIFTKIILFTLVTTLFLSMTASAQLNSLAVWENIADGTLTSTWTELVDGEWKGENQSGDWVYNCTTDNYAWTYNNTVSGSRWFQTFEAQISNSDAGIGAIQTRNSSDFYGVLYYLDNTNIPDGDGTPDAYIVYNDGGTMHYWNGSGYDTNISNASDVAHNYEADLLNDYCRVKALWNWNTDDLTSNCTVRFKIWNPNGTEPLVWNVDEGFTYYTGAGYTSWKPGLFGDASFGATAEVDFRRIFFWNLSYDLYAPFLPTPISQIRCPTYDAMDFYDYLSDYIADDDVWNNTQRLKTWMNTWDLSSYYDNNFFDGGDYNDTSYVFTNMLVDFEDAWEELYPADPLPDEVPDNTLILMAYVPIDATPSTGDEFLIRIDSDNNDVYDTYDYAFLCHADVDGFQAFQGNTELTDADQWYGYIGINTITSGEMGEMFADHTYKVWTAYINWDLLYNGTSGLRIGDDICRMSISVWNENDSLLSIWQDWDMTGDIDPYPASEEHNSSASPTWIGQTDSSAWGVFWVDATLGGADPMADPDDPEQGSAYDDMDETTRNLLQDILPVLLAVLIFITIVGIIFTTGITKETLISIMILTILGIIIIQVVIGL